MNIEQLGFGTLVLMIIVVIIAILITQYIWNIVMPDVFGTKQITFWQTVGLLILTNIFFGGHCNASSITNY